MTTQAWYHIDTLVEATNTYRTLLEKKVAETEQLFRDDPPIGWVWDKDRWLPHKRALTLEEHFSGMDPYHSRFYWLYPGLIDSEIERCQKYINIARHAHRNLILMDGYARSKFGGVLTLDKSIIVTTGDYDLILG